MQNVDLGGRSRTRRRTGPAGLIGPLNAELHDAAELADVVALRAALAEGADVDARKIYSWHGDQTALYAVVSHLAAPVYGSASASEEARTECVRALLEAGASPSATQKSSISHHIGTHAALHEAACHGWYAITKLLLDAGADVNSSNAPTFITPLKYAANSHGPQMKKQRVAALLLSRGASDNDIPGLVPYSSPYILKIRAAGGFPNYERQHRAKLVAMLAPKLLLPPELVSIVISFWVHVGCH